MRGKEDKQNKAQSKKQTPINFFTHIEKICEKFSWKHLDKIINNEDTPTIVFLIIIAFIFSYVFPKARWN